jgi:predicted ribosome-associated RNA-binding protein Tma20
VVLHSQGHINLVVVNQTVLFFNIRDGPYYPTLRLLHKCTPQQRSPAIVA